MVKGHTEIPIKRVYDPPDEAMGRGRWSTGSDHAAALYCTGTVGFWRGLALAVRVGRCVAALPTVGRPCRHSARAAQRVNKRASRRSG